MINCSYICFWKSKGSESLDDDGVADPVKSFFNVKAQKLEWFVVEVGILNEVGCYQRWFLNTLMVRPHDVALPRNQLLQYYRSLHYALVGQDQVRHIVFLFETHVFNFKIF